MSNGHGEAAIAERLACEIVALAPDARLDHLALVGEGGSGVARPVGPQRALPSGGLIAMGNARNLARDLGAGLLRLVRAQRRFLCDARGTYDVVVAVGDAYGLWMTLHAHAVTVFVGTAKSVYVAPYGRVEERLLARARACFVRDEPTAQRLRSHGIEAASANAIVDLFAPPGSGGGALAGDFDPLLTLFPGSRANAYDDAAFLLRVVRELARESRSLGAILSIAPGLDPARFAERARDDGWSVEAREECDTPFVASVEGRAIVRAWRGELGTALARASIVLGQAGTANEAAAAAGIPVVAFERARRGARAWYRKRQAGLLGEALAILPDDLPRAVAGVRALLADGARRARMARVGRERMGPRGGARRIAERVVALAAGAG